MLKTSAPMRPATIVVPCFNEAQRLHDDGFRPFLVSPQIRLLFVNDGSTDETEARLHALCGRFDGRARTMNLAFNQGKGEAVRQGMLSALAEGAETVGYFDADLATPPSEMLRLIALLEDGPTQVALAARVGLLGTRIDRRASRHYLGRVFATFASLVLHLRVYDTQCGAKVFRRSELLAAALSEPFTARWAFDVELLGRLLAGTPGTRGLTERDLVEMPLRRWTDIPDSKLSWLGVPMLGVELIGIKVALMRWRARPQLAEVSGPVPRLDSK
jgi:dolichyl-phosphate beta-glucosyltransferase